MPCRYPSPTGCGLARSMIGPLGSNVRDSNRDLRSLDQKDPAERGRSQSSKAVHHSQHAAFRSFQSALEGSNPSLSVAMQPAPRWCDASSRPLCRVQKAVCDPRTPVEVRAHHHCSFSVRGASGTLRDGKQKEAKQGPDDLVRGGVRM